MRCGDKTFGVACELDVHAGRHRNGLLVWWNPPLLVLGGEVVDAPTGLEETAAVGKGAVSGSALTVPQGEPERVAASSSSAVQLTELPGSTWEDIFR